METNQYMDMFLDESKEHLQSLNDGLLGLEDNAEDLSITKSLNLLTKWKTCSTCCARSNSR